ncbi:histidine phosphatase family protein [Streptomyces sp. CBMA156]|uniref:histidine phosphatase family protein n=1 Tax=Streptomyces sp. CBMA156 TaxID=1930280 RepID=UPI001661972C|nr:histidine phosphatase family protein [Streptomyces sp. CBMA156]MBD0673670.1 histidine phosphatase family protein [Streptomyces sp. CBMA156]
MTDRATRYLYLARHGEAASEGDGSGLTATGRRQAALLGRRLAGRPVSVLHHGPLPRAAETARLVAEQLDGVRPAMCEEAGDFVPYVPQRSELPEDCAEFLLNRLAGTTARERTEGALLAQRAVERFTGPVPGGEERHELVVTHAFLVGWLVRHALDAPAWRWLGVNAANAALTVLRYTPGRPPAVLLVNDQGHLPEELHWTGFPPQLRC